MAELLYTSMQSIFFRGPISTPVMTSTALPYVWGKLNLQFTVSFSDTSLVECYDLHYCDPAG